MVKSHQKREPQHKMPVASPINSETSGFISLTQENNQIDYSVYSESEMNEDTSSCSDSDSDDDNSFEDSEDDATEEDTEEDFDEGHSLLSHNNEIGGLFEEYFDFDSSLISSRGSSCDHTISRPCHFCAPSVSMRLANEVRIAFKSIFSGGNFSIKSIKFEYVPLDPSITEVTFKALKALHDLNYIKCVLDEIIHFIITVQNIPDYKINYSITSAILRIHDRADSLLDDIRGSDKYEEYQVVMSFRNQLNSIGLIQAGHKENNNTSITSRYLIECQR